MAKKIAILDDLYPGRLRVYKEYSPALRSERTGLKLPLKNKKTYTSCAIRTRTYAGLPAQLEIGEKDICHSIDTVQKDFMVMDNEEIRIRRITPKECFRLMDFEDRDHDACKDVGVSNSQLYKQAGNSIVVNCLVAIFGQIFEGKEEVYKQKGSGNE